MIPKYLLVKKILLFLLLGFILSFTVPKKVKAVFIKHGTDPIVNVGNTGEWDSYQVNSPSILVENGLYKMWYTGGDGNKREIGYAESSTPFSFQKYVSNPIISWQAVKNSDIGVEHPSVLSNIPEENNYKMWYSNVEKGLQNFYLFYSTSSNGIIWSKPVSLVFDLSSTAWDSQGMGAPSVVFNDQQNKFHQWYVAKGYYNGSTRWRFGYATSTDGINWTKHSVPIMEADLPWEGENVGNPSVILEDGVYHMFYHATGGIGHATSFDGITWYKDQQPILTPGPSSFDSRRLLNPFVLKKDGIYYLWYTGEGNDWKWRIGMATSNSIPPPPNITPTPTMTPSLTITPSPTLIPTPIPTLTPSIIPTLSPTPKPSPFSPIIFLPGLGGSWNPQAIFSCDLSLSPSSKKWRMTPFITVYNRLIKTLTQNAQLKLNHDFFIYAYDWRQPLDIQGENLNTFIENVLSQKPSGTKVKLIGHSLGGLVIRSYLSHNENSHRVETAITVGTPHQGSPLAYPLWAKGEVTSTNRLEKMAMIQLINHCRLVRSVAPSGLEIPKPDIKSNREVIQSLAPSLKTLLPIFDYLRQDGKIKPVKTLNYQNDWLIAHPVNPESINLFTISGNNRSTIRFFEVINPSHLDKANGNWLDGKPVGSEKTMTGDGTVLGLSSTINGANNEAITGDHGKIISSDEAIKKILAFLNLANVTPAQSEPLPEITSESILTLTINKQAKIELTDFRGKTIKDENQLLTAYNPETGVYKLIIIPLETNSAYLNLIQINNTEEKSKTFSLDLVKNKTLTFLLPYFPANFSSLRLIKF